MKSLFLATVFTLPFTVFANQGSQENPSFQGIRNNSQQGMYRGGSGQLDPNSNREQEVTIKLRQERYTGESVIHLKQQLRDIYPRIDFSKWDLKKVILNAKSAEGRGTAQLSIGGYKTYDQIIDGSPYEFNRQGFMDKLTFYSPSYQDQGVWQLLLNGNIKVGKVTLFAKKKEVTGPGHGRPGMETQTCKYSLKNYRGYLIENFQATSTGRSRQEAKSSACKKALVKCSQVKRYHPGTQCSIKHF